MHFRYVYLATQTFVNTWAPEVGFPLSVCAPTLFVRLCLFISMCVCVCVVCVLLFPVCDLRARARVSLCCVWIFGVVSVAWRREAADVCRRATLTRWQ